MYKRQNYYYSEVSARMAARTANSTAEEQVIEELNVEEGDGDAPVIKLVQSLIIRGYNTGASDIHIEPFEDKTVVRMRVDGAIVDYVTLQDVYKRQESRSSAAVRESSVCSKPMRRAMRSCAFPIRRTGIPRYICLLYTSIGQPLS